METLLILEVGIAVLLVLTHQQYFFSKHPRGRRRRREDRTPDGDAA